MKRFLAPLALVAALALAAPALAGTKTYSGPISPSGSVSLKVKVKHGKPKKVNEFSFVDIPVTCDDGTDTPSGHYPAEGTKSSAKIQHKEFSIQAGEVTTGAGLEIVGTVKKKAGSGTIQLAGDTSTHTNCASGVLNWTASR